MSHFHLFVNSMYVTQTIYLCHIARVIYTGFKLVVRQSLCVKSSPSFNWCLFVFCRWFVEKTRDSANWQRWQMKGESNDCSLNTTLTIPPLILKYCMGFIFVIPNNVFLYSLLRNHHLTIFRDLSDNPLVSIDAHAFRGLSRLETL